MKTVLTIDFDIIMDSYTELYNHLEYMPWEIRLNNLAGLREMPCNAFHYEKIMNLLFALFKLLNKEKIHFIKQHHSIFHLLDKNFKRFPKGIKPLTFDYGYCITCHKSQGSEYDKVLVFEEHLKDSQHARWLYTAATRAKKKLIIVKDRT